MIFSLRFLGLSLKGSKYLNKSEAQALQRSHGGGKEVVLGRVSGFVMLKQTHSQWLSRCCFGTPSRHTNA